MDENMNNAFKAKLRGIALGLLLMAFFTIGWAGLAENKLKGNDYGIVIMTFSFISIGFIGYAVHLIKVSKKIPRTTSNNYTTETKVMIRKFYINFGIEIIAIGTVVAILRYCRASDYIIPSIAFIAGLHFYPLAKIFKRKIDYVFATWTCMVSLLGIVFLYLKLFKSPTISIMVAVGTALATTGYGIFMIYEGRKITKLPKDQPQRFANNSKNT